MDQHELNHSFQSILEGMLYIAGEDGLSVMQLQSVFSWMSREEIEWELTKLQELYDQPEHGVQLACYASRWKLVSREFVFEYAKQLYEEIKAPSLSSAALETLAIIAYKQPVTRVEIEEIRGVNCEAMLKKLQLLNLIKAADRLDVVGKPLLYTVTDLFLDTFALDSLAQLPAIETGKTQEDLFGMETMED